MRLRQHLGRIKLDLAEVVPWEDGARYNDMQALQEENATLRAENARLSAELARVKQKANVQLKALHAENVSLNE